MKNADNQVASSSRFLDAAPQYLYKVFVCFYPPLLSLGILVSI